MRFRSKVLDSLLISSSLFKTKHSSNSEQKRKKSTHGILLNGVAEAKGNKTKIIFLARELSVAIGLTVRIGQQCAVTRETQSEKRKKIF